MNRELRAVLSGLPSGERATLRKGQSKWIRKRNLFCERESKELEGGNAWAAELYRCLESSSQRRTHEFAAMRGAP